MNNLELPNTPMNNWQVSEYLFGDSNNSLLLAEEAFKRMKAAGWIFLEYDENGEEVWQPAS